MRRLWPHLLLRLRLTGLALSWLSLALLLTLATVMTLERAANVELRSEATVDRAWQRNVTCLSWDSSHLRLARYQSTQHGQQGIPLLAGTVRKLSFGRAFLAYDDPGSPATGWSFPGITWRSSQTDGRSMLLSNWELALLWPYPLLILALPALPAIWQIYRWLVHRYRIPASACPGCGYDLSATPDRCPECGTAVTIDPHTLRYAPATPHPGRWRAWLAHAWMTASILAIITMILVWNMPSRWVRSPHPMGPHILLAEHQAICMLRYSSQGTTAITLQWHDHTLGLWAQIDSSAIVIWIPYWLPLAIAGIAPMRAIWRRIRYGPPIALSSTANLTLDSSRSSSAARSRLGGTPHRAARA